MFIEIEVREKTRAPEGRNVDGSPNNIPLRRSGKPVVESPGYKHSVPPGLAIRLRRLARKRKSAGFFSRTGRGAFLVSCSVLICVALLFPAQTATTQQIASLEGTESTTFGEEVAREAANEKQISDWLSRLTLEEKVQFLRGDDQFSSRGNKRLGIPGIKMADSPQGVRAGGTATMFPSPVAMAATWDTDLIERVGNALGAELRAKGSDMLLGPCVNIHRSPLGGRNSESFGEDPLLASKITVAYIKGVQSQSVAACVKHFAANNIETRRLYLDVEADARFLHEIEFPAFRAAVQEAGTLAVMASYNKVNGEYSWANRTLLDDVLRKEWGYKGIVVSDWGAEWMLPIPANLLASTRAGLDIHMPNGWAYGEPLIAAVKQGQVSEQTIDEMVRRVMRVTLRLNLIKDTHTPDPDKVNTLEHQALAREVAARSIVLLKNTRGLLPLDRASLKSIAVIGPNADVAPLGDRGSANVPTPYTVSPLQGLRNKLSDAVAIHFARGYAIDDFKPMADGALLPDQIHGDRGLRAEYFANKDLSERPVVVRTDRQVDKQIDVPEAARDAKGYFSARWSGKLMPGKLVSPGASHAKILFLGLRGSGGKSSLYLDDHLLIENTTGDVSVVKSARVDLMPGHPRELRLELTDAKRGTTLELLSASASPNPFKEAVAAAGASDVAVIFAGLNTDDEGEGMDRFNMNLPGLQDELIQAVSRANPRTVVVLFSGTPNRMTSWVNQVPAVVQAWYPGMEGGNALAEVLLGDINPSGKLPVTFGRRREDYADFPNFPGKNDRVRYAESIFVGYRHFDKDKIAPLYPFGHGLSYTNFAYGNLNVRRVGKGTDFEASVDLKNAGKREGSEVLQLYIGNPIARLPRPPQELRAFDKVRLKPGETTRVVLHFDQSALSYYDPAKSAWTFEPGKYEIRVGSSSRDIRARQALNIDGK
jgi:beta-glucosidase